MKVNQSEENFQFSFDHRLNMELDLYSLGSVYAVLVGWDPATPPPAFRIIYEGAIGQLDRRHLFGAPRLSTERVRYTWERPGEARVSFLLGAIVAL